MRNKTRYEQIEVEDAYKNGAKIEYYYTGMDDWCAISFPNWHWHGTDYRIKQEKEEPVIATPEELIPDPVQAAYWKQFYEDFYKNVKLVVYHEPKTTVVLTDGTRSTTICNETEFDYESGFLYAYVKCLNKALKISHSDEMWWEVI